MENNMIIVNGLEELREELSNINVTNLTENCMSIIENNSNDYDNAIEFMKSVINYGCKSGVVNGLIYFSETKEFFINNMDDIFNLYNELKEECGELNFEIGFNNLAWFAFEEICRQFLIELDRY